MSDQQEETAFRKSLMGMPDLDRGSTPRYKPYHAGTDFKRSELPGGETISVMRGLEGVDYDDMILTMTQKSTTKPKGPKTPASVTSQDYQAPPENFNALFNSRSPEAVIPNPTAMARPGGDISKSRRFELISTVVQADQK